MAERWWLDVGDDRFWKSLLIIGVLLNVTVCFTSDLGVDTHVRMAADDGELPWGHTRPIDPQASDPDYSPTTSATRYDALGSQLGGELGIRIISLLFTLLLIGLTYASVGMVRGDDGSRRIGIRAAALVAIYPTFIFSTGRGYSESILATLLIAALIPHLLSNVENSRKNRLLAVIMSTVMLAGILAVKGYDMMMAIPVGVLMMAWFALDWNQPSFHNISRNPLRAGKATVLLVGLLMLALGASGNGGSLAVIASAPARFASALLISAFDIIVVYMLFGMVLWPFVHCTLSRLGDIEDQVATILTVVVSGFVTAITIYVAALWTYESLLWDSPWPWVTWTMGNNGRYISLVMVPTIMLLTRIKSLDSTMPFFDQPTKRTKAVLVGCLLILPISILTAVHGRTMWTDDAAEVLDINLEDGEDFLFIHDATLGMHHLYTFHTGIDSVEERNVTGHWRAPGSGWQDELVNGVEMENRGNLSNVQWIVFAPGTYWVDGYPEGWNMRVLGHADFMNGGGDWEIWSTHVPEPEIGPF